MYWYRVVQEVQKLSNPCSSTNTSARRANRGRLTGRGRERERERERERKPELYCIGTELHRKFTVLQKLRSPCRAELLQVSSSTNTSACRANGGWQGEGVRERERERERVRVRVRVREGGREGGREKSR